MRKAPCCLIIIFFLVNAVGPLPAQAQEWRLPAPGVMVHLSPPLEPMLLTGIKVHPDDPLRFDFIVDKGDASAADLQPQAAKLIKYFLAGLTVPEKDLWVNLSPYEKNRIIPASFGQTEMGRDLLAEDYILKQITASLIYPEEETGKKFWAKVYAQAAEKFGTTDVPVNTFNKVWIVPEKAVVYENAKAGTAYVVDSRLKVMLEQDYLALQKTTADSKQSRLGSDIVREIVIPELTREVNQDKNFAALRQVYNSLILASWYKKKIRDSILAQVYENKNKVKGVRYTSGVNVELIYQRYLQAFKKGVFNYIKEETDPLTRQSVPRKYFSGGADLAMIGETHLGSEALSITSDPRQAGLAGQGRDLAMVSIDLEAIKNTRSVHESTLTLFLRFVEAKGYLKPWTDKTSGQGMARDILKDYFKGQTVLNVGPEDNITTGVLSDTNIMTALRARGIDAVALSPAEPRPEWPKDWYVQGKIQDALLDESTFQDGQFDAVIISSLFELYYWTYHIPENRMKNSSQMRDMYVDIARGLQRVLKDNGEFFLMNYHDNKDLVTALRVQGFKFAFPKDPNLDGMVFINHKDHAMASDAAMTNPSLDGRPFSDFVAWMNGIADAITEAVPESELDLLSDQLNVRGLELKARAFSAAQAARAFYQALPKDGKINVYLFRDAFSLYTAERAEGGHPLAMPVSKTLVQKAGGASIDLVILSLINESKARLGLDVALPIPEADYERFKNQFFVLFDALINGKDIGQVQEPNRLILDRRDNLRSITNYLSAYAVKTGLTPGLMRDRGVRFIDTTMRGTFVLLMEAVAREMMEKAGVPRADIEGKTDGRMFYSSLSQAISFLRLNDQAHARTVELGGYPIELKKVARFEEGVPFDEPSIQFDPSEVNKFVFFMTAFKSAFLAQERTDDAAMTSPLSDPADITTAQELVASVSARANELYKLRNGPFNIQQYIPLTYRKPRVEHPLPADIHGGEALWQLLRDMAESPVFSVHYQLRQLNRRTDYKNQLINIFYDKKWITGKERTRLRQDIKDIAEMLRPYLQTAAFDRRGVQSISDANVRMHGISLQQPGYVDQFYGDYYQKTQFVYGVLSRVMGQMVGQALPAEYAEPVTPLTDGFVVRKLESGFYIDLEKQFHFKKKGEGDPVAVIDFPDHNAGQIMGQHPELMVKVFQWAAEHHALIAGGLLRAVQEQAGRLGEVTDPMQEAFLKLLESRSNVALVFLKMYETGLLGKFLPEFDDLKYHFEVPSHRFSVPVHTLYLLYFLEHLSHEDMVRTYEHVSSSDGGYNLAILRLGILLHDLQKQTGAERGKEPHPIGGALKLIPRSLSRLRVSQDFRTKVQWLVWHHQEMGARSGSRMYYSDITDLLDLGGGILDQPLWDIFYLLSVADANSVDPYNNTFVESGRQDTMLQMFHLVLGYFRADDQEREAMREDWRQKAEVESQKILSDTKRTLLRGNEGSEALIDQYLSMFSPYYFRTIGPGNLIAQFHLFQQVLQETTQPFAVHSGIFSSGTAHGPMFEVLVGANRDAYGMLYKIGGVLAALGFNVWDAKINTTPQGMIFDRFRGYFLSAGTSNGDYWESLIRFLTNKIMGLAVSGQIDLRSKEFAPFDRLKDNPNLSLVRDEIMPALIKLVLEGHLTIDEIFAFNKSFNSFKRTSVLGRQKSRVIFEPQAPGAAYSILDLDTDDRLGLLYMVSRILTERFNLNIQAAPISTFQKGLVDKFIITAQGGHSLNRAEQEEIARFLENFLDRESVSNDDIIAAAQGAEHATDIAATDTSIENTFDQMLARNAGWLKPLGDFPEFTIISATEKREFLNTKVEGFLHLGTGDMKRSVIKYELTLNSAIHEARGPRLNFYQQGYVARHELRLMGIFLMFIHELKGRDIQYLSVTDRWDKATAKLLLENILRAWGNPQAEIFDRSNGTYAIDLRQLNYGKMRQYLSSPDAAMNVVSSKYGGIDLTANKMPLQVRNSGGAIRFRLDPAQLARLQNAPGFTPVIISIKPVKDLQSFLGIVNPAQ